MMGVLIAAENTMKVWPLVKPFLQKAVDQGNGEFDIHDVAVELFNGQSQLWIGYDSDLKLRLVATTKIEMWPKLKRLRVELMGGADFEEFMPMLPTVEAWGKEHGCTQTIAAVRPGLRKLLVKEMGFKAGFETVIRGIP